MLVRTRPFHPVFDRPSTGVRPAHPVVLDHVAPHARRRRRLERRGARAHRRSPRHAGRCRRCVRRRSHADHRRAHRPAVVAAQPAPRHRRSTPSRSSARYVDGRLTVTVAAVAAAEPRRIEVVDRGRPAIESHDGRRSGRRSPTSDNGLIRQRGHLRRDRNEVPAPAPTTSTSPTRRPAREPGVDRVRDQVEVDAAGADDEHRRPSARRPMAEHGGAVLDARRGTGGCVGATDSSPISAGSCSSRHRSRRSGTSRLSGCGGAPGGGERRPRRRRRRAHQRSGRRRG